MKEQSLLQTVALYQALCPEQLENLVKSDWQEIQPGAVDNHFCYLKLNQRYAEMMARQWEVPMHGRGYVVRIVLPQYCLQSLVLETVAYEEHLEYRLPVDDLSALSHYRVGDIVLVSAFRGAHNYSIPLDRPPLASLMG
ncbi:MAG: hypothetical protein V7746_20280 [Halioglobus sp.]